MRRTRHAAEMPDSRIRLAAAGRMRASRGFSLIELMVVVGIIALLIAMLVPSLITARERTRLIMCQSNQRNLVYAWHSYLKDFNDRLPRDQFVGITFGGKEGAPNAPDGFRQDPNAPDGKPQLPRGRRLNRYLGLASIIPNTGKAEVFSCPGDKGGWIPATPEWIHSSRYDYYGNSYRCNRFVVGPVPPETSWYDPCQALMKTLRSRFDQLSLNVSTFSNESRLILLGDYGFTDWQNPANNSDPVEFHARSYRNSAEISYDPMYSSRHNVGYVDGHVSFVDIRKGIHVCAAYTVIPFRDMQQAFADDQKQGHFP